MSDKLSPSEILNAIHYAIKETADSDAAHKVFQAAPGKIAVDFYINGDHYWGQFSVAALHSLVLTRDPEDLIGQIAAWCQENGNMERKAPKVGVGSKSCRVEMLERDIKSLESTYKIMLPCYERISQYTVKHLACPHQALQLQESIVNTMAMMKGEINTLKVELLNAKSE